MSNPGLSTVEKERLLNRISMLIPNDLPAATFLALPNFEINELQDLCKKVNDSQNKFHLAVDSTGFKKQDIYTQGKLF